MSNKLSFHDRQHIQKMLAHEQVIANIFNHFVTSVSPDLKKWTDTGKSNVWVRNASVEKAIDKRLIGLQADLINSIDSFKMDAWNRSNLKNNELVEQYIKDMAISEATKKGLFAQNRDMLKEFQGRKEGGMNLSANIWDIAGQTKSQLEFYLESGLSVGRSAATISQDIRQTLNDPDKKFHRIKDKNGNLVMSQPMKDYHPGQGQYRSSAMNAKRVAVTETNMMYRKADSARWAEMDFVMGFEVNRSGSSSGACSICDALTGPYPKGFVYAGWHPFCICVATPILLEPEEFAEYLVNDTIPQERIIRNVPDKAREFVNINRAALMNSYYVKDNAAWFSDKKSDNTVTDNVPKNKVVKQVKSEIERTEIQRRWDDRKDRISDEDENRLYSKIITTENEIRMNAKFETAVLYDKNGNVIIDKRGKATSVSFTTDECKLMKDGIMTHNHPRGWAQPENSLGRIGNSFSPADILTAVSTDLSEIRAVTPTYTFVMKRPTNGWGVSPDVLKKEMHKIERKVIDELKKYVVQNRGKESIDRANAITYHRLSKKISSKYGWEYSKAKTT